jgi:hypothetical protein
MEDGNDYGPRLRHPVHALTSLIVQPLHDLPDNLSDRLDGFDIVLSLLVRLLQVPQGKSHYQEVNKGVLLR